MVDALTSIDPLNKSAMRTSLPIQEDLSHELRADLISKPLLESSLPPESTSPAHIFARMMDTLQHYVKSLSATAELKQDQVGRKMHSTDKRLRHLQKEKLEAKETQETWQIRHMIANCIFNGITALTGVGLAAAGNPWTGGSLIVSGLGNTASEFMHYYEWDPAWTGATSVMSTLIGLCGGLSSGALQAARNPHLFLQQLNSGSVSTALQLAATVTSFVSTGVSGYAMVERHQVSALLAELESFQTQANSTLRLLQQKYSSANTSFQGSVKGFSDLFKSIAKTQTRYTRDCMRMLTADFPA